MLTVERHNKILGILKRDKITKIVDLTKELATSESTIRRDLITLEQKQKLKRIHGGATLMPRVLDERSILEKADAELEEKQMIAQKAIEVIEIGDAIFLDAGSTVAQIIPHLQSKNTIAVTNGISHVSELLKYGIETVLLGGKVKPGTEAVVGAEAYRQLLTYRFDKVFLGANGVTTDFGFSTPDVREAEIKQAAIKQGKESFMLIDYSKFGKAHFAKIADFEALEVITDRQGQAYLEKWSADINKK